MSQAEAFNIDCRGKTLFQEAHQDQFHLILVNIKKIEGPSWHSRNFNKSVAAV